MKRTDISDDFYQKDRNSSKGQKKNVLKESDTFERKKRLNFKNYFKEQRQLDTDEEDGFY
jgi:hypothetical protein